MLPILKAEQIRAWDKWTIENEPISSVDLMERAGLACCQWLLNKFKHSTEYLIACGSGNNGGDGLVIARHLIQKGKKVHVWLIGDTINASQDFKVKLSHLKSIGFNDFVSKDDFPDIQDEAIVVDAIFGTGINRAIEGHVASCIQYINDFKNCIVSIDMPSGMLADEATPDDWISIVPDYTLTFQSPKLAFLFEENESLTGKWELLDIGLDQTFPPLMDVKLKYQSLSDYYGLLEPRGKFDSKWSFGHGLLIAGSGDKAGAGLMASEAALRSGIGLLTLCSDKTSSIPLFTRLPEAMFHDNSKINDLDLNRFSGIGIGPGIGTDSKALELVKLAFEQKEMPMVIDADAINVIAKYNLYDLLPIDAILTPHIREFERLAGVSLNAFERLELQKEFSIKHQVYLMLKGAFSVLTSPQGDVVFNSSGNPGMAKGGSGDCLTGVLTGLLAQGYEPYFAAKLGMMVHGWAGDLASEKYGETSMLATDIVNELQSVFKMVCKSSPLN